MFNRPACWQGRQRGMNHERNPFPTRQLFVLGMYYSPILGGAKCDFADCLPSSMPDLRANRFHVHLSLCLLYGRVVSCDRQ